MSKIFDLYEAQLSTGKITHKFQPKLINIHKIYPNPTNTSAIISLSIPKFESKTTFTVLDMRGRTIASKIELFGENQILTWDGLNDYGHELPSEFIFYLFKMAQTLNQKKLHS